jgi:hypothetical protein
MLPVPYIATYSFIIVLLIMYENKKTNFFKESSGTVRFLYFSIFNIKHAFAYNTVSLIALGVECVRTQEEVFK